MMDRWTTEETEDGFRLNYSEDFSVYAYADAAALEEIKDAHNAERDRLAAENAELRATMANDKPAASPWRYDVENAPMDVRLLASWGGDVFEPAEYNKNKAGYLVWAVNDMLVPAPIAFATINQPEMPND